MPTYEYRCKSCGTTLEAFQSFTDRSLTECQECGGPLRKLFGNVGISFKGSGFYKTDSRSGNGSSGAKEPADKSSSESSSTDDKGDKKESKSGNGQSSSSSDSGSGSKASSGSSTSSSD